MQKEWDRMGQNATKWEKVVREKDTDMKGFWKKYQGQYVRYQHYTWVIEEDFSTLILALNF